MFNYDIVHSGSVFGAKAPIGNKERLQELFEDTNKHLDQGYRMRRIDVIEEDGEFWVCSQMWEKELEKDNE